MIPGRGGDINLKSPNPPLVLRVYGLFLCPNGLKNEFFKPFGHKKSPIFC